MDRRAFLIGVALMAGDGLVRPFNAPPAAAAGLGVQPGTSTGPVYARYVIISGANDGWFVYSGTPGLGNPPIAWAASGTTDPYGNALPNSATLGIASTGTFRAGNSITTPAGTFTYSGTPALGNLLTSQAPAGGTDLFGNTYEAGNVAYTVSGTTPTYIRMYLSQLRIASGTPESAEGLLYSGPSGTGTVWTIQTETRTGDSFYAFTLASPNAGGLMSWNGTGLALSEQASAPGIVAGKSIVYANANGTPAAVLPSGFAGALPVTQTDTVTHTVGNVTSPANLSHAYVIPTPDAQAGTVYELEVPLTGTYENQQLNLGINLNGTFNNVVPVSSTFVTAGHGVVGTVKLTITVTATGAGGTVNIDFSGTLEDSTVVRSASTSTGLNGHLASLAFDTTVQNTFALAGDWGGLTAGQTISGTSSKLTRSGP